MIYASDHHQLRFPLLVLSLYCVGTLRYVEANNHPLGPKEQACNSTLGRSVCLCDLKQINCRAKNLLRVPYDVFVTVETLTLSNNFITEIEKDDFKLLTNLKVLYMSRNRISIVHPEAFLSLHAIRDIILYNNLITTISSSNVNIPPNPKLTIDLKNNLINSIDEDTLFKLVGLQMKIFMKGNPLQCSCDLFRAKNRLAAAFSPPKITDALFEVYCISGSEYKLTEAPESVFQRCSDQRPGYVDCRTCDDVKTYYAYSHCRKERCNNQKAVCQFSFAQNDKGLSISSFCGEVETCYEEKANTHASCGKDAANVSCVFCCLDSDCIDKAIQDNFVDYTIDVIYNKQGRFTNEMKEKLSGFYQTEEDRVAAAITPMITSLPGGVDVFIRRFEEIPGAKDEHHVRLKLKVSVLSSTSFDTVLNAIRHNISSHFLTPGNWFSTEMIDTDSVEVIDPRVCYNSTTIEQSQTVSWPQALQGETRNVIVQTAHSSFILTRTCISDEDDAAMWGVVGSEKRTASSVGSRRAVAYLFWASIKALKTLSITAYYHSVGESYVEIVHYYQHNQFFKHFFVEKLTSSNAHRLQSWDEVCYREINMADDAYMVYKFQSAAGTAFEFDVIVLVTDLVGVLETVGLLELQHWANSYYFPITRLHLRIEVLAQFNLTVQVTIFHEINETHETNLYQLNPMEPHLIAFRPEILQSSTEGALGAYISAEQPFVVMLLGFEETSSVAYGSEQLSPMFKGQVWYYLKYDTRDPSTQFFITTTENNTLVELPSMKNSFNKEFMPSLIMLDDLYQNFREITSDKPAYVVTVTGPGQTLTSLMPVSAWTNVYFIVTPDLQILNFEYFLNIHSKFIENIRIDGNEIKVWQVKYDLGNGMTYGVVRLFEHNVKYVTETHNFGCSVYGKVKTSATETSRLHYIHHSRSTPGLYKTFIDELRSRKGYTGDVQDDEVDEWGNLIMTTLSYSPAEECPSGFYGVLCDRQCKCPKVFCNKLTGECYEADCHKGWFGDDCMTEDLASFAYVVVPEEFFDGDEASCRVPENNTIYIELIENFYLISFNLVLKEPTQLIESDIVVSVYDRKVKGYVRKRVLVKEETPIRFTLQLTTSTLNRRIFVNIQKAVSVCTLNINGAQGLVKLHQSAKVSIPGLADNDTLLQSITDGGRYNTCISTNRTDRIFIEFEGVENVFRIVIYPGDTPTTFEVTCTNQFNQTVHYLKLTTHTRGPSFIHTNKPMHKIEVKTSDPKFEMCEIEIFGSLKNNLIAFNTGDYVLTLPPPITERNLLYILLICILFILVLSKLEDIDTEARVTKDEGVEHV